MNPKAALWIAVSPEDVELLVVTTVVPDHLMPPTSTLVQEALEIPQCVELEISANCTAPYKALWAAANELELGHCNRALVCSSQYASFLTRPPWSTPEQMTVHQGALRWIVSDGAGALALARAEPDIGLRVRLESAGVGKRSGMFLPFGAASPDFRAAPACGDQHITQDNRYVLREGFALAVAGFGRMLEHFGIAAEAIDHFISSISAMEVAGKLRPILQSRYGLRPEVWRMNLTRVGYNGGVTILSPAPITWTSCAGRSARAPRRSA